MQTHLNKYDVFFFTLVIGLVAAILSLFFLFFFYAFHFITFHPFQFNTTIIMKQHWFMKILYYVVLCILFSVLSIICSIIYFLLFRKQMQWQVGALYGVLLWGLFYIGFPYLLFNKWILMTVPVKSSITMFCFFLLYGVFVGYSISYYDKSITMSSPS